jgi:hypothetical protein
MANVVLGMFKNQAAAEQALRRLQAAGYDPKNISVIAHDKAIGRQVAAETGADVAGGAVQGATTGAVVGGLAGLLIGVGAITLPGVGGLLIAGPIAASLGLTGATATTVSGALTGALAGGVVGALVGLGVPKETAQLYETGLQEGGIILAVPTSMNSDVLPTQLLADQGATNIVEV